jgi:hypothetical protein
MKLASSLLYPRVAAKENTVLWIFKLVGIQFIKIRKKYYYLA